MPVGTPEHDLWQRVHVRNACVGLSSHSTLHVAVAVRVLAPLHEETGLEDWPVMSPWGGFQPAAVHLWQWHGRHGEPRAARPAAARRHDRSRSRFSHSSRGRVVDDGQFKTTLELHLRWKPSGKKTGHTRGMRTYFRANGARIGRLPGHSGHRHYLYDSFPSLNGLRGASMLRRGQLTHSSPSAAKQAGSPFQAGGESNDWLSLPVVMVLTASWARLPAAELVGVTVTPHTVAESMSLSPPAIRTLRLACSCSSRDPLGPRRSPAGRRRSCSRKANGPGMI